MVTIRTGIEFQPYIYSNYGNYGKICILINFYYLWHMNRNIAEIKSNPKNPRVIKDEKFAKLVQSLKDFPEMLEKRPLVCFTDTDGKLVVLGGNMRLKAAKEIGLKELPVIIADDWTEEQKAQFLIKDNVGFGEWNWDELQSDWDVEQLADWGLDIPSQFEVKAEAEEDDFDVPEGGIETDIVLGDLFEIGEHRLLCGDSTDSDSVARLMDGQKADMVFTDPPYGMKLDADYSGMKSETFQGGFGGKKHINIKGDHDDFTEELINTIFACFNDCKEIFIWGADYFAELLPNKNDGSWIVWDKRASGNDDISEDEIYDKMYGSTFELCWSKNKHKRDIARVKWAGVFGMPTQDTKGRVHPTQKPIELANWFFNKWGKDNDLIADLYLGGGTTMVASHQLKRKCYGMELDPKYCQVIIDRMLKLDPSITIKKNGHAI
jgi:site-specific DNA-methyltransferase (adenine-specific)